ncbi:MAG: hypothetical protein ACRDFX_01320 [Chloroflexota bacterium]
MKRLLSFGGILVLATGMIAGNMVFSPGHASAASSLKLSRSTVGAGNSITVQGYGFSANDNVVVSTNLRVSGSGRHVQTGAHVGGNGYFSTSLTVPRGTNQGTYALIAKDSHGNSAGQNFNVLSTAFLRAGGGVHTTYVLPNLGFYVTLSGFQANETVNLSVNFPVYGGNTVTVSKSTRVNGSGVERQVYLNTPANAQTGTATLTATGQSSHRTAHGNIRIVYRANVYLSAGTVRPGTNVTVHGSGFPANSTVHLTLPISRSGATSETLTQDTGTDGSGAFTANISLPTDVHVGQYTVTATDTTGGFHASARVSVSVHPSIHVQQYYRFPGQVITVTGSNFGSGTRVVVAATFSIRNGGNRRVAVAVRTNGNGDYTAHLRIPRRAAQGRYAVTGRSGNAGTQAFVQIRYRSSPKPTPAPTKPAPAPTSVPATAVPTSTPHTSSHHNSFGYRYISIWWHTVRVGTAEHLVVQASLHTQQGLWVHVWFPSGQGNLAFYVQTDGYGHWQKQFPVGTNTYTGGNNHVLVTFRLWHGKSSRRYYGGFSLVR